MAGNVAKVRRASSARTRAMESFIAPLATSGETTTEEFEKGRLRYSGFGFSPGFTSFLERNGKVLGTRKALEAGLIKAVLES